MANIAKHGSLILILTTVLSFVTSDTYLYTEMRLLELPFEIEVDLDS